MNYGKKYDYKVLVINVIDHKWLKNQTKEIQEQIIWSGTNNIIIGRLRAYRILQKENPDVLISSLWKSVSLAVLYKLLHKKTKLIGFFHSSLYVHRVDNFFMKIMGRIQDKAFADSNTVKNLLKKTIRFRMLM